eukprot:363452-Chlamydomonas_euryale.AAC.1
MPELKSNRQRGISLNERRHSGALKRDGGQQSMGKGGLGPSTRQAKAHTHDATRSKGRGRPWPTLTTQQRACIIPPETSTVRVFSPQAWTAGRMVWMDERCGLTSGVDSHRRRGRPGEWCGWTSCVDGQAVWILTAGVDGRANGVDGQA